MVLINIIKKLAPSGFSYGIFVFLLLLSVNTDAAVIAEWHFDETSGTTAYDATSNNNDGTLTNMSAPGCWEDGYIGNALHFDGSNDYVSLVADTSLNSAVGSISIWIKADTSSEYGDLLHIYEDGYTDYLLLRRGYDGKIYLIIEDGDVEKVNISSDTAIADTDWHHIAVVQDGTSVKIYIDGVASSVTGTNSGSWWTNHLSLTGGKIANSDWLAYDGLIDELKIYNNGLSANQVWDLSESIRAELKFDETSGTTAYDATANDNDGTLTNMTAPGCWEAGRFGNALHFDGSNDYVSLAGDTSLNSAEGTIAVWIKADTSGEYGDLLHIYEDGYTDYLLLRRNYDGKIYFAIEDGDVAKVSLYSDTTIADTDWHHVAVVQDGTSVKIYIDGVASSVTGTNSGSWWTDHLSLTGAKIGNSDWLAYDGLIDELKIYGRAFSEFEVWDMATSICGEWNFNETSGTTAYDATPYENDGTLTYMDVPECWDSSAIHFYGATTTSEGYVDIGTDSSLKSAEGTIELLVKPDFFDVRGDMLYLGAYGTAGHFVIRRCRDGRIYVEIEENSVEKVAVYTVETIDGGDKTGQAIGGGSWHNLSVTQDGNGVKIYIDGKLCKLTGTNSGYWTDFLDLYYCRIGNGGWPDFGFFGLLDDVIIYNRALSASEISGASSSSVCAEWNFDESSGTTAYDASANANDGTLTNMTAPGCWEDGRIGNALHFDGSNDYVALAADSSLNSTVGTISAWIKADTSGEYGDLLHIYEDGYTDYLLLRRNYDGKIYFAVEDGDVAKVSLYSDTTIADTDWHHVAVVQDGTSVKIYIDGTVSTVTGTNSGSWWTDHLSLTGAKIGNSDWLAYDGLIDELKIYNTALNATQISDIYDNGGGQYGFGCEENPTGDPIGGGSGYSDIITSGDADYIVDTKQELLDALAVASSGDIIYVDGDIDLDGESIIDIPAGITLAGNRGYGGTALGAKLYRDDDYTGYTFRITGSYARITGLRLEGPNSTTSSSYYPGCIKTDEDNELGDYLEVDNCEISGWAYTGIYVGDGANNVNIHHNYIHHCQLTSSGYGVSVYGGDATVKANKFDYCKHSIAGGDIIGSSYEASYNLFGANTAQQDCDMHGETDFWGGSLKALWRFNEMTGTTTECTSPSYGYLHDDAVLTSMDSPGCWVDGQVDGALYFDGTGYVSCDTDDLDNAEGMVEMWLKADSGAATSNILHLYEDTSNYFKVGRTSSGEIFVKIYDGNVKKVDITTSYTINDTSWHHVVVTQDGSGVDIYVDGTARSLKNGGKNSAYWTSHLTSFGSGGCKIGEDFEGILDEVRVYSAVFGDITSSVTTAGVISRHATDGHAERCGDQIKIHHNTFETTPGNFPNIWIRGIPATSDAEVYNNWFKGSPSIWYSVRQDQILYEGGISIYQNLITEDRYLVK